MVPLVDKALTELDVPRKYQRFNTDFGQDGQVKGEENIKLSLVEQGLIIIYWQYSEEMEDLGKGIPPEVENLLTGFIGVENEI